MFEAWIGVVIALHVALIIIGMTIAGHRMRLWNAAQICFFLLLPVFGAVTGFVFVFAREPDEERRRHLMRSAEMQEAIVNSGSEAVKTVPLEEALLINTPTVRRELMMNLLRSDPRKHLDLLIFARYNEDPETAHYATATLTEAHRQIQLELQQMQVALSKNSEDVEGRVAYIRLMDAYTGSGLLEGHLLERQRLEIQLNLDALSREVLTQELFSLKVRNLLALRQAPEARSCAREMLALWPQEEESWLEMLRVLVETYDEKGLAELKRQAEKSPVAWSRAGLERMRYFWGEIGES